MPGLLPVRCLWIDQTTPSRSPCHILLAGNSELIYTRELPKHGAETDKVDKKIDNGGICYAMDAYSRNLLKNVVLNTNFDL
jgi:hypothetical protein